MAGEGAEVGCGIGDVVDALVDVDEAVMGVRILRQLALVVEEAALGRAAPDVGTRRLILQRNLRREVVVGGEADLVLAQRSERPGRSMYLETVVRWVCTCGSNWGRVGVGQARREDAFGPADDARRGCPRADPDLQRLELLGRERGKTVWHGRTRNARQAERCLGELAP